MSNILLLFKQIPAQILVFLIKFYQKTLSPDHGPLSIFHPHGFCRFQPSCSQYGVEAISKHGAIKGSLMLLWRLLRCNPWNKGGIDQIK